MSREMGDGRTSGPSVWPALLAAVLLITCADRARALNAGDTVTTNVVLNQDLVITASGGSGLFVGADNITIDGNGHRILNNFQEMTSRYGSGINVGGYSKVTIKNFQGINGFMYGISGNGNVALTIDNCRIERCMQDGIKQTNPKSVTVRDCILVDAGEASMRFDLCTVSTLLTLTGNTFLGGRAAVDFGGASSTQWTIANNRFYHQSNDYAVYPYPRVRLNMLNFGSVARHATVGTPVSFSVALSSLTGEAPSTVQCNVRTIPAEGVVQSRSGDVVSGSFQPSRNGLYSVVAEASDTHGNISLRAAKIQVGPTSTRSVTYYMSGWNEGPVHGPAAGYLNDQAGMNLTPPAKANSFMCAFYVNWYVDTLPPTPAAAINKVRVKTLFSFKGTPAEFSISRVGTRDISHEKAIAVSGSLGNGAVQWGEFEFSGLDWLMDYPQDWYFMALSFSARSPQIYTGDPLSWGHPQGHLSQTVFDYTATVSPEVKAVSKPALLVMGATAPVGNAGTSEKITVWGSNDQADLTLANFRRPFLEVPTQIGAASEALFSSGLVVGEKTFNAVPLEVLPTAAAVRVQVAAWPSSGEGLRQWTESAVGAPGAVTHTLLGLSPLGNYRITAGGSQLLVGAADALGKLSFVYSGAFPATLAAVLVPANLPPAIVSAPWAVPNPVVLPGTSNLSVVASDSDGGPAALTYSWSKTSGPGTVTFAPNGTTASSTSTASFGQAGTYSLKVTVSDGAASVTDSVTVTVNPAPLAPVITTQPASVTVASGQTATFTVAASGTAPLTYQWRRNGTNLSGANGATYTTPATTPADHGALFSVVVSNSVGSATSSNAVLTIADTVGPALAVGTAVLKGTVSDAGGVSSLKVNGVAVTVGAGGTWQTEVPLTGATTTVTLTATDNAGNVTNKTVTIAK